MKDFLLLIVNDIMTNIFFNPYLNKLHNEDIIDINFHEDIIYLIIFADEI